MVYSVHVHRTLYSACIKYYRQCTGTKDTLHRYHNWSEERLAEYNRKIDTIYIAIFIPSYFVSVIIYFLVILVNYN